MGKMLTGLGYEEPKRKLPFWLIYGLAVFLQLICFLLRPVKVIRPTFTPMTVALAGTHHSYSCQAAKQDLDYQPRVPLEDGVQATLHYFSHLKKT